MSPSDKTQPGPAVAARTAPAPSREQVPPAPARPQDHAGRSSEAPGTRPVGAAGTGARGPQAGPRTGPTAAAPRPAGLDAGGPRRVQLTVARVDPWSVMKLAFLLSVALGIALVVATGVLWSVLDGMGVFADVNRVVGEVMADEGFDVKDFVGFGKVLSLATVIAVVDVVLFTAIATLGAFLYNLAGTLVGGLHVTLSDD